MSVVDLHPENLLDKEIRGELDGADRERLEAHLAQCATCRMERELRADFQLELSRDSVPPEIAGLVESLARREKPSPIPAPTPVVAPTRGRARRVKLIIAAVAATLTLVAGAFASTEAGHRVMAPFFGREAVTPHYGDATSPTRPGAHVPLVAQPATPVTEPPTPSIEPVVPPAPLAPAPEPSSAPALPPVVQPVVATAPPDGPAPLFTAEADARRRGDGARVLELHAQLVARYPQSREAQVSRMMVARMLMDRGDAAGALSGFDAYLRNGSGELREDALAGRATALDRLGRTDEGRRAWMALLDQYPNTAYGAHARSRVEASGER